MVVSIHLIYTFRLQFPSLMITQQVQETLNSIRSHPHATLRKPYIKQQYVKQKKNETIQKQTIQVYAANLLLGVVPKSFAMLSMRSRRWSTSPIGRINLLPFSPPTRPPVIQGSLSIVSASVISVRCLWWCLSMSSFDSLVVAQLRVYRHSGNGQ